MCRDGILSDEVPIKLVIFFMCAKITWLSCRCGIGSYPSSVSFRPKGEMIRLEIKSSVWGYDNNEFQEYGRDFFGGPFIEGVMLERDSLMILLWYR